MASDTRDPGRLREATLLALKLGCIAFGGPAAHIALLRQEVVTRRKWLTDQHFLDLLGATNLIPGPNSTEMVMHVGHLRAGWPGLVCAGAGFILPAAVIVTLLAWAYARYGATPTGEVLLYGIKPVIIAIVLQALWGLGRTAAKTPLLAGVGLAAAGLYLLGWNEIGLLAAGAALVTLVRNAGRLGSATPLALAPLLGSAAGLGAPGAGAGILGPLFLIFLKIGAVLYGSGYVLLAFLRNDFVLRLGWLSDRQLLDAVAVGQFTPGPVLTTATFIGYLVGDLPGAFLATLGIFLPAFVFVAALNPLIPRLRRSPWPAAMLDGVNVAALGLMTGVTWQLARAALVDLPTVLLAAVAALLLFRLRVNSAWLVLGGGLAGLAYRWLAG
ncbi:MAG: chromate efflux transporter [Candidatus Methylomirabilales bacterium]